MREKRKKLIMCILVAVLFIAPIVVFGVLYRSAKRDNRFKPTKSNIQVQEENAETPKGDMIENDFTLAKNFDDENYSTQKSVQIYDERSNSGESLRVCFVPAWYDDEGCVCGGIDGVTNISEIKHDAEKKQLIFYTGSEANKFAVITLKLAANYAANWEYKKDGCFYFSGTISADKTTPKLVESVEVTKAVYDKTQGYKLRLDVLADSIQTSGNAYSNRSWNVYEP